MEESNPPNPDGDSKAESLDDQGEQGANLPDPAGGSGGGTSHDLSHAETPQEPSSPPTPEDPDPPEASEELDKQDEDFGGELEQRSRFLVYTLLGIILDGIWSTAVYIWFLIADKIVGPIQAKNIEEWEYWMLIGLKVLFTYVPGLLVIWYVIIDFIGAARRIWDRRTWRKRK